MTARRRDALAVLTALAAATALRAPARAQTTIRVGCGVADPSSEALYAQALGFFTTRGLDVNVQQFTSGASEAAAVAGGALDVAESNVLSLAQAHLRGLPFVCIAPAAEYSSKAPTTTLACAKDAPFRTGKDLTGKTLGVQALRDNGQLGPMVWIEKTGGDPYSLRYVELQFMQNAWFTTTDWTAKNPDGAARFADAIRETARWANRNHQASAAIFKQHSKVAPEIIDAMRRSVFAERLDVALFQPIIDAGARFKMLDRAFPASEMVAKLG